MTRLVYLVQKCPVPVIDLLNRTTNILFDVLFVMLIDVITFALGAERNYREKV